MFGTKALGAQARRYISTVFGVSKNYKNKPTIQQDLSKTMDHFVQKNPELAKVKEALEYEPEEILAEAQKVHEAMQKESERLQQKKEADEATSEVTPPKNQ
ncbi:MAG: hypothetical protein Q9183_003671 [Haloplaca sp. 2 TL-2023]